MSQPALTKGISGQGEWGRREDRETERKAIMEEEEEEVLCYLDRVLEEEELFEYGDGELDPITPTHTQFKVRRWLDS